MFLMCLYVKVVFVAIMKDGEKGIGEVLAERRECSLYGVGKRRAKQSGGRSGQRCTVFVNLGGMKCHDSYSNLLYGLLATVTALSWLGFSGLRFKSLFLLLFRTIIKAPGGSRSLWPRIR